MSRRPEGQVSDLSLSLKLYPKLKRGTRKDRPAAKNQVGGSAWQKCLRENVSKTSDQILRPSEERDAGADPSM